MPLYFDHCNYHSFNRLVNAWSFRRMSAGPDKGSYYHELFLRGRPNLNRLMRRLPKSHKKSPLDKKNEPDFYSMPRMDALVPNNNETSPAALAAAAAIPASVTMSAGSGMNMKNLNNMNMNMAAFPSGLGRNLAAATNDVGQLSLMGLHQGMHRGMGMGIGMGMFGNQNHTNTSGMADSTNNFDIQTAMARIAQQQRAKRAQMSSLLGMGPNDHATNMFQQQSSLLSNDVLQSHAQMHQQDNQDHKQQDYTSSLESNLRATQLEHDRLQQQIATLQAQQQAIANEQLQLQQFQQAAVHQMQQPNEASLQALQESKMPSPVLGAAAAGAGDPIEEVANSPAAKSG